MITLFAGNETQNWGLSNFDNLIQFCRTKKIERVALKIYDITQGEWYTQFGGPPAIIQRFKSGGVDVLPYGYFYGNDVQTEATKVNGYLAAYGKFCMDMGMEFDNSTDKADLFSHRLTEQGILYVTTWANPVSHGWSKNIGLLDNTVDVWVPKVYADNLNTEMYAQFPKVLGKIEPVFYYGLNTAYTSIYPNFSLWDAEYVLADPALLENYQLRNSGDTIMSYPTNKGMVANYLPVDQFQPGYSEFVCGGYAVSLNLRATPPNVPNTLDPLKVITWAENEYKKVTGSNGPNNTAGVSVDQMHTMLKDTQLDSSGGLHYWDISSITSGSAQVNDITQIKKALSYGYPVIATVTEQSIYDLDLGHNPYWWGANGNHIITYVGVATDGSLLVVDPANVQQGNGNLQTPKSIQPWPRRYDANKVQNLWATIIQPHWLPAIPSNTPAAWPAYQPPAQPDEPLTMVYDPNSKQIIFMVNNSAVYRIQL